MKVITWDVDDIQETMKMLDMLPLVDNFIRDVGNETLDTDAVRTDVAISICKTRMLGEYHSLLVKQEAERLIDSEIYVLTWQGEASEHGEMFKLDVESLIDILVEFESAE